MNATHRIDFDQALAQLDLKALVRSTCTREHRGRFGCPWHTSESGTGTTLTLHPGKDGRWRWRCWSCDARGDALDWLARLEGGTRLDAAKKALGLADAPGRRRAPTPRTRPLPPRAPTSAPPTATPRPWQSAGWQGAVDDLVLEAEAALWSDAGRAALEYLRSRRLEEHTIRRFRLGYVPEPRRVAVAGSPGGLWVERGILIPWVAPEAWYCPIADPDGEPDPASRWCGANVRRLPPDPADFRVKARTPDPKYKALTGSGRGFLYPFPDLTPGVPCLVVEGELDSLIGWQEAGWVVNVVSVGGAGQTPQPEALDALAAAPHWLVLPDADGAGEKALAKWEAIDADATAPVLLPGGSKDLTDFVVAGGDVLAWLESEYRGLGWAWRVGMG